jgi:signal transduction histidine kinase
MQEAITNAVKHAGVRSLAAALHGSAGEIRLEVSDSGCGFDPNEAMHSRGLGLVSMRERVSLMNGELRITSTAGAGTVVRARVPLRTTREPGAAPA